MIQLNDKDFYTLWSEALAAEDCDRFVSEWSTSRIWGDQEELTDEGLLEIADYLAKLWDCAHMGIREICAASRLSQTAFAIRFCVPKRTVEDWCRSVRTPPDYFRLAATRLLGLLP